ncbi:glycoprotein [Ixcanal virus]|uniref:Envelopment polyprotein n=1 Tax=Ixcanal virus TaxID=1006586 RepID=F4ZCL5_9VIRU|nr:glycoprotein [Ixcanal virus]AEB70983.1 glycoprotein [Ixcanal virus]
MKIIQYFCYISFVVSRLVLHYSTPTYSNKICFSSGSPEPIVTDYWMEVMESFPPGHQKCELGDGQFSAVVLDDMPKFIKAMTTSDQALRLTCIGQNDSYISELTTDGDVIPGEFHSEVDCKNGAIIKELSRVNVAPAGVHARDLLLESAETDAILKQRDQLIAELREKLRDSKVREDAAMQRNKVNTELLSETKDRADKLQRRADELILHLESERVEGKISRNRSKWLEHELKDAKEDISRLRLDIGRTTTRKPKGLISLTTTMIPLLLLMTSEATKISKVRAKCSHARNRIGSGKNTLPGVEDSTCSIINYETRCDSLESLMVEDLYPFASSHIHKQTLLEAYNDNFITKDSDGVCDLQSGRNAGCYNKRSKMRPFCPNGFRAAHYIDDEGKLRGVYCPSGMEMSEDCLNCRKMKTSTVRHGSIQMQDAMCQEVREQYSGPLPAPRGYCRIGNKEYKKCKAFHTEPRHMPFISLKGAGKVYLDGLVLRNDEEAEGNSFICYKHKGQYATNDGADARIYEVAKLSDCSVVDSSKQGKCTGDHVFCSKFRCEQDYPEVSCVVAPGSGPVLVRFAGGWVKPVCFGYENVIVDIEVPDYGMTKEDECEACVFSCDDDGIRIRTTGFKVNAVIACSSGHCSTYSQEPSTNVFFKYPGVSYSDGSKIGVHLSHDDDTISSHMVLQCEARDSCSINSCILCSHTLINYQCHTFLSALACTIFLTSCLLLIVFVVKRAIGCVKTVPSAVMGPMKWLRALFCWVAMRFKQCFARQVQNINAEIGWRPNNRVVPIPRYTGFMAIMLSLFCICSACSETALSDSKISKCSVSDGKTICTLNGAVVMKVGTIGTESCFMIKSPNGQKSHISLKTVSSELVCREGDSFWTSDYSPKCLSSRRCYWVGECHSTNCQSWDSGTISTEFLRFGNETRLSENKCFEQCGGVSCGCFNMNPSCLFSHASLESVSKKAVRAFSCVDWTHRISFEIVDTKGQKEKFSLSDTGTKFTPWGSLSLGIDAESITGTNSMMFLQDPLVGFALIDEELSSNPRAGFIGEVRCSSEITAISAHKSCKWAPNLIKYRPVTDFVECSSDLINPFTLFRRGFLPQYRNGKMFTQSIDKKSVQAVSSLSIRATVRLLFEGLQVEFIEEENDCKAAQRNVTGCYLCNEGARVCLSIASKLNGTFYAESLNGMHMAVQVTQGTSDYCSYIHFDSPSVSEIIHYSCGGTEKELHITGTLISVEPHDDRNPQSSGSIVVNPREAPWSLMSWIRGFISFFGGPLKTAILVIGLILLALIIISVAILVARSGALKSMIQKAKIL